MRADWLSCCLTYKNHSNQFVKVWILGSSPYSQPLIFSPFATNFGGLCWLNDRMLFFFQVLPQFPPFLKGETPPIFSHSQWLMTQRRSSMWKVKPLWYNSISDVLTSPPSPPCSIPPYSPCRTQKEIREQESESGQELGEVSGSQDEMLAKQKHALTFSLLGVWQAVSFCLAGLSQV